MAQESWNLDASDNSSCQQQQQQDGLVLCTNNCGFFGCASTMNLCSNCFHELSSKKQPGVSSFSADPQALALAAASVEKSVISALSEKSLSSLSSSDKPVMSSNYKSQDASKMPSPFKTTKENSVREIHHLAAVAHPSGDMKEHATVTCSGTGVSLASSSSSQLCCSSEAGVLESDLGPLASLFSPKIKATEPSTTGRQNTNKCFLCRKRTGLLGFKCRCGNVFCASHRHSVKHDCPFDYKAAAREAIAKANPVVRATKIHKI